MKKGLMLLIGFALSASALSCTASEPVLAHGDMATISAPSVHSLKDVSPKGILLLTTASFESGSNPLAAARSNQPVLLMTTAGYLGRIHPLCITRSIGKPADGFASPRHWRSYNI